MQAFKISFSSVPVPLNERLTIAPVKRAGGALHYYSRKTIGYELVLTAKYKRWINEETKNLAMIRKSSELKTISDPCVAVLVFTPPADKKKHDVDGIFKAPFDALTKAQVIKDDYLIRAATVVTPPPKEKGFFFIMLATLDEDTVPAQKTVLAQLLEKI